MVNKYYGFTCREVKLLFRNTVLVTEDNEYICESVTGIPGQAKYPVISTGKKEFNQYLATGSGNYMLKPFEGDMLLKPLVNYLAALSSRV